MTDTDSTTETALRAMRASLSAQSTSLSGVVMRLRAAQQELVPADSGGCWRGKAARSQSVLVNHLDDLLDTAGLAIERARDRTDAALWAL